MPMQPLVQIGLTLSKKLKVERKRINGERASLPANLDELMAPIIDIIREENLPSS